MMKLVKACTLITNTVSYSIWFDWLSAGLSKDPVQVFRQNTPLFTTTDILYNPVITNNTTENKKYIVSSVLFSFFSPF